LRRRGVRSLPRGPRAATPFRVPGGPAGAWIASGLATGWSALALLAVLWPGLATSTPDAHLPDGFAGNRAGFLLTELVPLTFMVTAALFLTHRRRREPSGWTR
jgi:hypothetical protein